MKQLYTYSIRLISLLVTQNVVLVTVEGFPEVRGYRIGEVIDWGDSDPSKEGNYQLDDKSKMFVGSNPFAGKGIVFTEISLDWNMYDMYAGRWAFYTLLFFLSFNQWCVLNQVPRGGSAQIFNFPRKKWTLICAA